MQGQFDKKMKQEETAMFCPDPVAFTIFGRDIYWYGILIYLSVVLAVIMV